MDQKKCRFVLLAAIIAMVAAPALGVPTFIKLDPDRTYLRLGGSDSAPDATAYKLSDYGGDAGDSLWLQQVGDFQQGTAPNHSDINTTLVAVFSSSATLLSGANLNRVVGAIDAGTDFVTQNTAVGNHPTDISQDFQVLASGMTIVIPAGATYVFFTADDIWFMDNFDPDNDWGVNLESRSPPPIPAPGAVLLSGIGAGLVGWLRRKRSL